MPKKSSKRITYPVTEWQREMIFKIVDVLDRKHWSSEIESVVQKLLNYLPEIQLSAERLHTVPRGAHSTRELTQRRPTQPLFATIREAEEFDDSQKEIMLIRFRAYKGREPKGT
jgi:hypothetical protein